MSYAELHCLSSFSFLRGASHPEELVERAADLGYAALAITDECSVAGAVRAHVAARARGFKLIIGSEFRLADGLHCVLLATNRRGYGQLCRLITRARRAAPKGQYRLERRDFAAEDVSAETPRITDPVCGLPDCLALWLPEQVPDDTHGRWLASVFPGRLWIAAELLTTGQDRRRLATLQRLGERLGLPLVAAGDVHMHARSRRALQDVLTATRIGTTVDRAGYALFPNGERHLRPVERLAAIYPPELMAATLDIAVRCAFSLDELRYEYPREIVPDGETAASWLGKLTEEGKRRRWPEGAPDHVERAIAHELALIAELRYEAYFLTVCDIVEFARSRGILCQGRGSAANSAVCYCLGITAVDPARMSLLFERFISRERNEAPDIDVDFEHERREEVMQYVYEKYGRDRAALTATVITYRPRSALRDVAKALGLDPLQVNALARSMQWWDGSNIDENRVREAGLDPSSPVLARVLALARTLLGFPRHLSQHVGGMVITRDRSANSCRSRTRRWQIARSSSGTRTTSTSSVFSRWIAGPRHAHGDPSQLRVRRAVSRPALDAGDGAGGRPGRVRHDRPRRHDGRVPDRVARTDGMLPRLKPRTFYDLVIEVAIVRPGPIQGDMVHPYLRRRSGLEPVSYPSAAVEGVLNERSACRSSRSRRCSWRWSRRASRRARPTSCAARWRPGSARAASIISRSG